MLTSEQLDRTFSALADPTRRSILERLALCETSVKELAEPYKMTAPAVTKHLKVLENAGLIERSRSAQWRPCKLQARPLQEATEWMEQYRRFWEESFDRLDAYLTKIQQEEQKEE